jgi:hypothetical protein
VTASRAAANASRQCNSADGSAKRRLRLPTDWSFSPQDIGRFVTARPHHRHVIDVDIAASIYRVQAACRAY